MWFCESYVHEYEVSDWQAVPAAWISGSFDPSIAAQKVLVAFVPVRTVGEFAAVGEYATVCEDV
jgi:hypothetical protein